MQSTRKLGDRCFLIPNANVIILVGLSALRTVAQLKPARGHVGTTISRLFASGRGQSDEYRDHPKRQALRSAID